MARRIKTEYEGEGGWTRWVHPVMKGYRMVCCDCGLAHDLEFEVLEVDAYHTNGTWSGEPLDPTVYRVSFRAKRNNRSTAQIRRHKEPRRD